MVAGAIALLLQDEPNLTPDQVKYRLMATANKNWSGYSSTKAGAGYLDVYAAVHSTTTQSANTGVRASRLLWTGTTPITWNSVSWNSVSWNSVSWNSVSWNSVSWNSVSWNSDYWESSSTAARSGDVVEELFVEETTSTSLEVALPTAAIDEASPDGAAQPYKILLPLVTQE
jgi:hypothetical protein